MKTKRKCEYMEETIIKRCKNKESPVEENDQTDSEQETTITNTKLNETVWRNIRGENLNCDYCRFLSRSEADRLLKECESTLTYNTGDLAKVHIYGKWLDIPRQQASIIFESMTTHRQTTG